jgi:hypothetical protein
MWTRSIILIHHDKLVASYGITVKMLFCNFLNNIGFLMTGKLITTKFIYRFRCCKTAETQLHETHDRISAISSWFLLLFVFYNYKPLDFFCSSFICMHFFCRTG